MKILITDFNIQLNGHHLGHVQNILNFLAENPNKNQYFFLLNPLPTGTIKLKNTSNIHLNFLSEDEYKNAQEQKSIFSRSKFEWEIIENSAKKLGIHHLILMDLDAYQIAIGSAKQNFKISGIWFQPFSRIEPPTDANLKEKLSVNLRKVRKSLTMRWCSQNNKLGKIFIFNDSPVVEKMNKQFGNHFAYLPDPVYDYPIKENFDIREIYKIDEEKVIFLIFGAIDGKKNVVNILKAFQKLSAEESKNTCLLIIGKVINSYKEILEKALEETRNIQPKLQIITENNFVENDEMEAFFAQSDVVLRMNVNFFASSGIIGIAAKHNKPSLVSDNGLVAELTEKYNLGIMENPENIEGIAEKLRYFLENPATRKIDGQEYYQKHDCISFAKTLLGL